MSFDRLARWLLLAGLVGLVRAAPDLQTLLQGPNSQPPVQNQNLNLQAQQLIQAAGRQVGQLSATPNLNGSVLEVLHQVGQAIQQQISSPVLVSSDASPAGSLLEQLANGRRNEYRPLDSPPANLAPPQNQTQREQADQLRQEIVRRAGQLQQVVSGAMDLIKSNGDVIVARLLQQLSGRLEAAKSRAERILAEPASAELSLRALAVTNQGLNNLTNIITNIVTRLELAAKQPTQAGSPLANQKLQTMLSDASKFRTNLQLLGKQFTATLNQQQNKPATNINEIPNKVSPPNAQ